MGRIGREIADRLAAFKMEIHYHARSPKADAPRIGPITPRRKASAAAVDWLVIALVGGAQTENYVSEAVLKAMPWIRFW